MMSLTLGRGMPWYLLLMMSFSRLEPSTSNTMHTWVPFAPEILKSSSNATVLSFFGSLASLSRTCAKNIREHTLEMNLAHSRPNEFWKWELGRATLCYATHIINFETFYAYTFEQFYFVKCRLGVVRGAFHHFQGHEMLRSAKIRLRSSNFLKTRV